MTEQVTLAANPAYPLEAILTLPDSCAGTVPAAVLVHGSGPLDKDETIGGTKLFRDLADGLAAKGVASIRYDKRTCAHGKQLLEELGGSFSVEEEIIQDAIFVANTLKADARVDAGRVFIIGHSQGGMLAPRIDAEGGGFAGLIILAGTMRTLDEVIMDQNADVLSQMQEAQREAVLPQVEALKDKFDSIADMADETAKQTVLVPQNNLYAWYLKEMKKHPAREYLEQSQKPVFALQGDKDVQVSVEKDFGQYREILSGRPYSVFKLYSGLNHLFMKAVYGTLKDIQEEYKIPQTLDSTVLDDIARWILSGCLGGRRGDNLV